TCNNWNNTAITGVATATDTCGPTPTVSFMDNVLPGNCSTTMTIQRVWKAVDCLGNTSTCTQVVSVAVNDNTQPTITCPPNVTVGCGTSTDPSATGLPVATDNCTPSPVLTFSDSVTTLTCPNVRRITRTWTATDCDNNTRSCAQTITVQDTSP